MKQKKQQSLIFVRVIATFLFTLFKVEINFSLQLLKTKNKFCIPDSSCLHKNYKPLSY